MLKLSINFGHPAYLFVFLVLCAFSVGLVWVLARQGRAHWIVPLFGLVNLAALVWWAAVVGIDEDEAELLHTTWMYGQGLQPYVEFWQHHFPLAWVALDPVVRAVGPSPSIYVVTRLIAAALTIAICWLGWRVAVRVWDQDASAASYLMSFAAGAGFWQFVWLRADLPMMLLLLAALLSVLSLADGRWQAAFGSGVFIALALSFTPKQWVVVLLPIAVIVRDGHRDYARRLLIYAAGGAIGALPLVWFVLHHGVFTEFVEWSIRFNSAHTLVWSDFPVGPALVAAIAIWLLLRRRPGLRPLASWVILVAFCLCTWASMFTIESAFNYYHNYWLVLVAVLGAGISVPRFLEPGPRRWMRSLAVGCVSTVLLLPNLHIAQEHLGRWFHEDLRAMQTFLAIADGRPAFMFPPQHPVFVRDATRLHTLWQYRFIRGPQDRRLMERDGEPDFVASIVASRPAIVASDDGTRNRLLGLKNVRAIDDAEYERLQAFLSANYTLKRIGEHRYYVINDRASLVP